MHERVSLTLLSLSIIRSFITREENSNHNASIVELESNWDHVVDSFDDMDLNPQLLRGVYAYGSVLPTTYSSK